MKKKYLLVSASMLAAFILWTVCVSCVDVQPAGPEGSSVGLAGINLFFHRLTGVHFSLYTITDWLGLIPIGMCMGFGILGLTQWIRRKRLGKVDRSLLALGGFYILTMGAFFLFEKLVINYRPVLIGGVLEPSYPSSTTLLAMTVMPTAALQLGDRLRKPAVKRCVLVGIWAFTAFMVAARLLSGVHWLTDIVGGALLSGSLVTLYHAFSKSR